MRRTVAVAALGALLLTGLVACGNTGQMGRAAIGVSAGWGDDVVRVLQTGVREGRVLAAGRAAPDAPLGAPSTRFRDLIARAPAVRSARDEELLVRLRAREWATGVIRDADLDAAVTGLNVSTTAGQSTGVPSVRESLTSIGTDIVRDIACSQLLDELSPKEQEEAGEAGNPVWEELGEPTQNAVLSATARRLSPGLGLFVDWQIWHAGLRKEGDRIAAGAMSIVRSPDYAYSRAFYVYVTRCQKLPGR